MAESTVWWLITGCIVAAELVTGTFYLLMLAIGLAAAALSAHAGLALTAQIGVAAVVGGGAVVAWHWLRPQASSLRAGVNRDVNLDIGETVHVDAWHPDGTTTVKYRGAQWAAVHGAGTLPSTGAHRIVEVRGSQLVIEKFEP